MANKRLVLTQEQQTFFNSNIDCKLEYLAAHLGISVVTVRKLKQEYAVANKLEYKGGKMLAKPVRPSFVNKYSNTTPYGIAKSNA